MNAVEFEAVAKDGRIQIPPSYAETVSGPVRVILLYEATPDADVPDELEELMNNPLDVPGFVPLSREEANERG